jgi:AraC-like DNA-binding protein
MDTATFSRVCAVAHEIQTEPSYHWKNPRPFLVNQLVVQRTVAGACFFEDATGRRLVTAGHAMLFAYDEPSAYGYPQGATEPYELIWLNFLPSLGVRPLFEQVRKEFGTVVRMAEDGEASACLHEILERYSAQSFRDNLQESELLTRLFHLIYREQTMDRTTKDPVALGHDLIQTRFRSPINLKIVAARCGISREHFIRSFRERYGVSPATMLRSLRLQHARESLVFSQMPVESIARDCGFTSSNSFCRAFRREFGHAPLEERTHAAPAKGRTRKPRAKVKGNAAF